MRLLVLLVVGALAFAAGPSETQFLGPIWADMDTGNVKVTITAHGGVGYTAPDSAGSGFRFPKTMTTSRLYYCGMLCGNDPSYIADRFYGNPAPNLHKDFAIVESLRRDDWYGGQEYSAAMDDSRHSTPKGLLVRLHAIALPEPYGNGVIIIYDYWNTGSSALNGMYAGLWADFDISTNGSSDIAYTDTTRRAGVIRVATTENPNCGLAVLYPHVASNISVVFHPTWVYPTDTCVTEFQKYRWLTHALHQDSAASVNDYSVIVATGPFDLAPGGGQRVAFAMLAGTTRAEFLRELDSLQTWFDENVPVGLAGEPPTGPARASITVTPNPVRTRAHIAFTASGNCHTTLSLFDRAGRQVEHLWSGSPTNRPVTLTWSNPGLDPGVYFLRLESAGVARTVKTIIAR